MKVGHFIFPWQVETFLRGSAVTTPVVHATSLKNYVGILQNGPEMRPSEFGPAFFTAPRQGSLGRLVAYGDFRLRLALRTERPFDFRAAQAALPGESDPFYELASKLSREPVPVEGWKRSDNVRLGDALRARGYDSVLTHTLTDEVAAMPGTQLKVIVTPTLMAGGALAVAAPVAGVLAGHRYLTH